MESTRFTVLAALALVVAVVPAAGAASVAPAQGPAAQDVSPSPAAVDSVDAAVAPNASFRFETSAGSVAPGENVTVLVRLFNEGPGNASGPVTVDLQSLPDGWSVVSQDPNRDGNWSASDTQWRWSGQKAREWSSATLTLHVPEDASGEVSLDVVATVGNGSGTQVASDTVDLAASMDATETTTAGTTAAPTTSATTTVHDDPGGSTPGFGVGVALLAVVMTGLVAARRR